MDLPRKPIERDLAHSIARVFDRNVHVRCKARSSGSDRNKFGVFAAFEEGAHRLE
jgi:hypothetical protein